MPAVTRRTITHTLRVVNQTSGEVVSRAGIAPTGSVGDSVNALVLGSNTIAVRQRASGFWWPTTLAGLNDHRIIAECEPVAGWGASGTWRLFLSFGQSGTSGRGDEGDLPSPWPPAATAASMYTLDRQFQLRLATEPLDEDPTYPVDTADDEGATTVGVSFSTALADRVVDQLDVNVCAIIVAKGGQAISAFAQNTSRNTLYGQACARVKQAVRITGRPLDAIFWYQGESDFQAGDPTTYAASCQTLFDNLRTDLADYAVADLPIIIVQCPPTVPDTFNSTWWANGRAAQASLAAAGPPAQVVVAADDGPFVDVNNLHLDTSALIALGVDLADAYLGL